MKRVAVYSDSRSRPGDSASRPGPTRQPSAAVEKTAPQPSIAPFHSRHRRGLLAAAAALLTIAVASASWLVPRGMNEAQVDAVVQRALEGVAARPSAAQAYEKI